MEKMSWVDSVTNEEVLRSAESKTQDSNATRIVGHILRRNSLL